MVASRALKRFGGVATPQASEITSSRPSKIRMARKRRLLRDKSPGLDFVEETIRGSKPFQDAAYDIEEDEWETEDPTSSVVSGIVISDSMDPRGPVGVIKRRFSSDKL